jgi:nucleoside-diphosphate-sugar epimerase
MSEGKQTVLVTGASGFVGSALVRILLLQEWRVVAAGRRKPEFDDAGVEWRHYDLCDEAIAPDFFNGIDAFVHAALVRSEAGNNAFAVNVRGANALLDVAARAGIARGIFVSSAAAHGQALSEYGKAKYAIEQRFLARGYLNVRPGLIVGRGGLFATLSSYLRRSAFIPLIDGGAQVIETVYIDDFVSIVAHALTGTASGTYAIASESVIQYRAFCELLARELKVKPVFVPVPFALASAGVAVAAKLRIRLPIDRDNLLGLRAMRALPQEHLVAPLPHLRDPRESIIAAIDSWQMS